MDIKIFLRYLCGQLTDEIDLNDPLHLVSGVMNEGSAVKDSGVVEQDVDVADLSLDQLGNLEYNKKHIWKAVTFWKEVLHIFLLVIFNISCTLIW